MALSKSKRRKIHIGIAVLLVLVGGAAVVGWYKFFSVVPQEPFANEAERFKYGSLGAEEDRGIPYPIFVVLPRIFGDLLPGPGGYGSLGIPWEEARTAGSLMGTKTILNEFLAYLELIQLPEGSLSERSRLIMTYAMCGFANFGSLGIMIGGMGSMAPERRDEIVALGVRSIVAGTVATCMTGAVVGMLTAL